MSHILLGGDHITLVESCESLTLQEAVTGAIEKTIKKALSYKNSSPQNYVIDAINTHVLETKFSRTYIAVAVVRFPLINV